MGSVYFKTMSNFLLSLAAETVPKTPNAKAHTATLTGWNPVKGRIDAYLNAIGLKPNDKGHRAFIGMVQWKGM